MSLSLYLCMPAMLYLKFLTGYIIMKFSLSLYISLLFLCIRQSEGTGERALLYRNTGDYLL